MKRVFLILSLITMMVLLTSCGIRESENQNRLLSPNNNKSPIEGKWIIKELVQITNDASSGYENLQIGREALFHKDATIVGKDYAEKPTFKIKTVKSTDYMIYKYKLNPEKFGIKDERIQVITVLNDNQYFNEFIKYGENNLLVAIDDLFYKMEKVAEQVSLEEVMRYIEIERAMIRDFNSTQNEKKESGVLLGIKTPTYDKKNELAQWEYKTLWISSKNSRISKIYELGNLLVPRKNGFWTISVERDTAGSSVRDILKSSPRDEDKFKFFDMFSTNRTQESNLESFKSVLKNILFVGNNYISIENIDINDNLKKTIGIYSLDNLNHEKRMKISDFIEENSDEAFLEGAHNILPIDDSLTIDYSNISIARKNAHWIFNGRVNFNQNSSELFKDFTIGAIPPKEIVSFDEHIVPWEAVKRKIPDAIDLYSSPNGDFVIIITNYNLQIFNVENKDISKKPVKKINLPPSTSIIMSEWASGRYVEQWTNEVLTKEGRILED